MNVRTSSSSSASTVDGPVVVSSSSPPPCTTQARSDPWSAQRRQHPLGDRRVGDADQLAADPPGVGHRAEQVEHRGDADLAAARRGEAERRMELRREAEADAGLLDAAQHALGRQLDRHAQRLEHVGGAALRRRRPGAVLAHRHAGAGDHDGGHRADVDRVTAVAAGADDVDRPDRSSSLSGTERRRLRAPRRAAR